MALKLKKVKNTGTEVEYWRIGKIAIDYLTDTCLVNLLGYVNKKLRDEGKQPELNQHIEISTTVISNTQDPRDDLYTHIKSLDAWASSEDI